MSSFLGLAFIGLVFFSSMVAASMTAAEISKGEDKCDNDALKTAHSRATWSAVLSALSFLVVVGLVGYLVYSGQTPNQLAAVAAKFK